MSRLLKTLETIAATQHEDFRERLHAALCIGARMVLLELLTESYVSTADIEKLVRQLDGEPEPTPIAPPPIPPDMPATAAVPEDSPL